MHRNLTPESVVLGPGGVAKLGELGMAKLASYGVVTTADQRLGAVLYAAPEQIVGQEEAGPRADLYGLGVLLYEAIAGVRPMGPGPFNVMTAVSWHLRGRARPLREHAAARGVPADLEALVHQMLEKTPSLRPVSALEVHDRLREVRVSLRAPLLREVRNAAPVQHSISLAPTQPMAAVPPGHVSTHTPGPAGGDRPAVLPAPVASPPSHPTPKPPAQPVPAAAIPSLGAPWIVARPAPNPRPRRRGARDGRARRARSAEVAPGVAVDGGGRRGGDRRGRAHVRGRGGDRLDALEPAAKPCTGSGERGFHRARARACGAAIAGRRRAEAPAPPRPLERIVED